MKRACDGIDVVDIVFPDGVALGGQVRQGGGGQDAGQQDQRQRQPAIGEQSAVYCLLCLGEMNGVGVGWG